MLEIVAMVVLGQNISKMVKAKGLKAGKYIAIMLLLWIGLEFLGMIIGTLLIGEGLAAYPMAILGAVIGAVISYQIAKNAAPKKEEFNNEILDANVV